MKKILTFLPGLTGAVCAYFSLKFIAWTGLAFEFAAFLISYLVVTIVMDSAMRSYGKKS